MNDGKERLGKISGPDLESVRKFSAKCMKFIHFIQECVEMREEDV